MLTEEFDLKAAQEVWREEGIEQGIEQGIERGVERVARKLKEAGKLSIEEIARYTGLSLDIVKNL